METVDAERTIANVSSKSVTGPYSATGEADLSVRGNLKVESFEKRFQESFSIKCIVHFKKGGKWAVAGPKHKALMLNEANSKIKEKGGEIIKL